MKGKVKGGNKEFKGQQQKQQGGYSAAAAVSPPTVTDIEDDMEFLNLESERVRHERPAYHHVLNMTETVMRTANPSWDPYYQPPAKSRISASERNKIASNLGRKLQDLKQNRSAETSKNKSSNR